MQKHQKDENSNYRACSRELTPLFLEKFGPRAKYKEKTADRSFSFSEKNDHCASDREFNISVKATEGWTIKPNSVHPHVKTSSKSSFAGIRDKTSKSFIVKGYVRNNGECIRVLDKVISRDGRGHVWGNISYIETREIRIN